MGLVCGQLYETDRGWRVRSSAFAFLLPFGCRRSLLGRPVPATDFRFPHGRPIGGWSCPPSRDGVSMFRTGEIRPVSGVSYTPGPWCSHGRHRNFSHHCRLPTAGPVLRWCIPSSEVLVNEACRDSHPFTLPVFPLPVTSGRGAGPWASSRASHPAVTSDACQEQGRALSTHSELTVDHSTLHFD
jgi:hypothetical protein